MKFEEYATIRLKTSKLQELGEGGHLTSREYVLHRIRLEDYPWREDATWMELVSKISSLKTKELKEAQEELKEYEFKIQQNDKRIAEDVTEE